MELDAKQAKVVDAVCKGLDNIFITGAAGVGKSVVISSITKRFTSANRIFRVVAPTGIAAHNVGGTTFHQLCHLGLGKEPREILLAKTMRQTASARQWRILSTLIIDECSMLDMEFFTKMSWVVCNIRNCFHSPFGGIQLVLVGDFFQLPPIQQYEGYEFLFECPIWKQMNLKCFQLEKVYRQDDDYFVGLLNRVRVGDATPNDMEYIASLNRPLNGMNTSSVNDLNKIGGVFLTELMSTNHMVNSFNQFYLNKLETESHKFEGQASHYVIQEDVLPGDIPMSQAMIDQVKINMENNNPVGKHLELKVGAQVMLCINTRLCRHDLVSHYQFFNGSRGVVVGFDSIGSPIVSFFDAPEPTFGYVVNPYEWKSKLNGYVETITYTQVPLKLAWAVSIHKSQGLTISPLCIDIGKDIFAHGQAYVALSRCKDPELLQVSSFIKGKPFIVSKKVKDFYTATFGSSDVYSLT